MSVCFELGILVSYKEFIMPGKIGALFFMDFLRVEWVDCGKVGYRNPLASKKQFFTIKECVTLSFLRTRSTSTK